MVKEGRAVYLENLTSDPMAQKSEVIVRLGIKSVIGTPLRYEEKVIGTITVGSTSAKSIDANDISLIGHMANQITTAIIKAQLYENERDARMRLGALEDISEVGLTTLSIGELINEIVDRMVASLGVDWGIVALFENRCQKLVVEHVSSGCSDIKRDMLNTDCRLIEDLLSKGSIRVIRGAELSSANPGYSNAGIKSIAMLPFTLRQDRACIFTVGKKADSAFSDKEINLLGTLGSRAVLAIENALLFNKLELAYLEIIESLVKAVEAKDRYTCGHSEEVAILARDIVMAMGLGAEKAKQLYVAGLLHDVGKIGISSAILYKQEGLTEAEYDEIKLHPFKGYQILKPIGNLKDLAEVVLQHHERYDGTGYPNGLRGKDILIEARILAVADAFQAMISDRPYRKGLPYDEAIIEIKKGIGSQFDPEVAETFISIAEKGELSEFRRSETEVA
ncbi:MAG TPA: HD domain-containing phosphohydrolase [Anaerolineae bacterium]|nr:HD domain-containing phosphohydrolase [Anaerolineae bacterium]